MGVPASNRALPTPHQAHQHGHGRRTTARKGRAWVSKSPLAKGANACLSTEGHLVGLQKLACLG